MESSSVPVNKVSDADWFLRRSAEGLCWQDLTGQVVLDIGFGSGKSSVTFLTLFPDIEKLIAIDSNKQMAEDAQANHPHEKLDYEVANILDRTSLMKWEGKFSKAISTYCFNTLSDPKEGFVNLHRLLRPGGEAALLIKLQGPYDELLGKFCFHPKWADYLSIHRKFFVRCVQPSDYESIAKDAGFQVVESYATQRVYDYDSAEEFKSFLYQSIPKQKKIPSDLEASCRDDLFETMLQFCPKTENDKFCLSNNVLSLLLRKPEMKLTH